MSSWLLEVPSDAGSTLQYKEIFVKYSIRYRTRLAPNFLNGLFGKNISLSLCCLMIYEFRKAGKEPYLGFYFKYYFIEI